VEQARDEENLPCYLVEIRDCQQIGQSEGRWAKLRVWWLAPTQKPIRESKDADRALASGKWKRLACKKRQNWVYRWQLKVVGLPTLTTQGTVRIAAYKRCTAAINGGCLTDPHPTLLADAEVDGDSEMQGEE